MTCTRLQPRTDLRSCTRHSPLLLRWAPRPAGKYWPLRFSYPTRGIIYVSAGMCLPPLSHLATFYSFFKTHYWEKPGGPSLVPSRAVLSHATAPFHRCALSRSPGLLEGQRCPLCSKASTSQHACWNSVNDWRMSEYYNITNVLAFCICTIYLSFNCIVLY